jgi:hypothetical protein
VGEAGGVATPVGVMEGHDVAPDVLSGVVHWLRKGCTTGQYDPLEELDGFRIRALEGSNYCHNNGCEVVGRLKDFKVCPQCKAARYWATRARSRTGLRVGTRKSVVNSDLPSSLLRVSISSTVTAKHSATLLLHQPQPHNLQLFFVPRIEAREELDSSVYTMTSKNTSTPISSPLRAVSEHGQHAALPVAPALGTAFRYYHY